MNDFQFAVDAATMFSSQNRALTERVAHLERAVVLLMQHQGISMKMIAKTTGIAYSDVRHWCKGADDE